MPTYLHPGVYLEEIPGGAKPIEGVATSIAAFVGEARRGPVGRPVLVHGLQDYERAFGPLQDKDDEMGFAATAYYQNGGRDAYFVRVVASAGARASSLELRSEANRKVLRVSANSVGTWGDELYVRVKKANTSDTTFTLEIGHVEQSDGVSRFTVDESFPNLSMNASALTYAVDQVNLGSQLVQLEPGSEADDQTVKGSLTGSALTDTPAKFAEKVNGLPADIPFSLSLDGLATKTITLKKTDIAPAGADLTADATKVALAITQAVQTLSLDDPFKGFECKYLDVPKQFQLLSPKSTSSSVSVPEQPGLAAILKVNPTSTPTVVHGASALVPKKLEAVPLEGGAAGAPKASDFTAVFNGDLKKIPEISVVVLPGQSMPSTGSGNDAIAAAVAHCEDTANRVLIIDPPKSFELTDAGKVGNLALPTSTYTTFYYPRVKVTNPFYVPNVDSPADATVSVGPSACVAGLWSRVDARRGVWKAPAGVETNLLGVAGLEFKVDDGEQDQLNSLGVNCLRSMPTFGPLIWGARTLATRSNPEWRYVSVRRTAIMIEQSVYNGIQWAVFEPNDHRLWASLRANIGSFMDGLFRAGAFQGEKASDAYFVRCGLGDTMTQGDIDRGQVIVVVGFAPLKPAEFVIVRIQQKVQQ
ncbi:phage tail sheath family protein [Archangium lansingense]|uniref:phage tail sheath family protein n=1 Tax=Archangium lansingense TaxID=2995310 RepID=UPI003B7D3A12